MAFSGVSRSSSSSSSVFQDPPRQVSGSLTTLANVTIGQASEVRRRDLRMLQGRDLYIKGYPGNAAQIFREIIKESPNREHPEAFTRLAHCLLHSGNYEGAKAAAQRAITQKNNQDCPEAYFWLAEALRALENLKESEDAYRNAISQQKNYFEAHLGLALVLFQAKDPNATDEFIKAKEILEEHGCTNPKFAYGKPDANPQLYIQRCRSRLWSGYGHSLLVEGKYADALAAFEVAIKNEQPSPFLDAMGGRADALFNLDRYQEALVGYESALKLAKSKDIQLPNLYLGLGISSVILERYEDGKRYLREFISQVKDNPEAYYRLGEAHYFLGEYQEATRALKNAILLKKDDFEAHSLCGHAYLNWGCRELQMPSEGPENTKLVKASVDCYKNAVYFFRKAKKIQDHSTKLNFSLGHSLSILGNLLKSEEYYKDAENAYLLSISQDQNGSFPVSFVGLADLYRVMGQADKAKRCLQRVRDDCEPVYLNSVKDALSSSELDPDPQLIDLPIPKEVVTATRKYFASLPLPLDVSSSSVVRRQRETTELKGDDLLARRVKARIS